MTKLLGVGSWNDEQISGIADNGSKVFRFLAVAGEKTIEEGDFKKADYKDYDTFRAVVGKYLPYFWMLDSPIKVKSVEFDDLIDVMRKEFPEKEVKASDDSESAAPAPEEDSGPKKLQQIPLPDEDLETYGDINYGMTDAQYAAHLKKQGKS